MPQFRFEALIRLPELHISPANLASATCNMRKNSATAEFLVQPNKNARKGKNGAKIGKNSLSRQNDFVSKNRNAFNLNRTLPGFRTKKNSKILKRRGSKTRKFAEAFQKYEKMSFPEKRKFFEIFVSENFQNFSLGVDFLEFPSFWLCKGKKRPNFSKIEEGVVEIVSQEGLVRDENCLLARLADAKKISFEIGFEELGWMLESSGIKIKLGYGLKKRKLSQKVSPNFPKFCFVLDV